jgi:hypothetical protein
MYRLTPMLATEVAEIIVSSLNAQFDLVKQDILSAAISSEEEIVCYFDYP